MAIAELKAAIANIETLRYGRPLSGPHPVRAVQEAVAEEIATLTGAPPEHVREGQRLADLGLDVLGVIALALALEERLRLAGELDGTVWRTVGDVVRMVSRVRTIPAPLAERPPD